MISLLNTVENGKKAVMKMKVIYKTPGTLKEQRSLEMTMRVIEQIFNSAGIIKHDGDMYIGNGDEQDYAAFGKVAIAIMQEVSLLKYIDEWLYYDEYGNVCDCGIRSKKNAGLLSTNTPDKTLYQEEQLLAIKMEIRYKKATESKSQRSLNNLIKVVDEIFNCYGLNKGGEHIYVGNGDEHDYARFGLVFGELNNWKAFLKYVDVWNLYNESGNVENLLTQCNCKVVVL